MRGVVLIDGAAHIISRLDIADAGPAVVARDGDTLWVWRDGETHALVWRAETDHFAGEADGSADDVARAPMPGSVVAIATAAGAEVKAGDPLMVIESMKLETTIRSPRDGTVAAVHVTPGQTFDRDAALVTLEDQDA